MEILILILVYVGYAISWTGVAVAVLLLLRMLLQWMEVNPFGWFMMMLRRVTEPIMRPMRKSFDSRYMRFDMMPILMAVMILATGFFISQVIFEVVGILVEIDRPVPILPSRVVAWIVGLALTLYGAAFLVRILLPYLGVGYSNAFFRFIFKLTEPVLKPLRRWFIMGMFDLSPLVAMLAISLIRGMLLTMLRGM